MAPQLSILEVEESCTVSELKTTHCIQFSWMYGRNKKQRQNPIKKPWTIATNLSSLGCEISKFQCDHSHEHVQGRGKDLKATERYTFIMTDLVHSAF